MPRALSVFALIVSSTLSFLAARPAYADGVRPQRFGPFLQQGVTMKGNPTGYSRIFPFANYNLQAGWMEPVAVLPWPLFRGSYIETQGNATVSPYQTDFGIAFNIKPIRFLEFGLGYNRLFFPNTLAGFAAPDDSSPSRLPDKSRWRPTEIFGADRLSTAGADIFTYQANLTLDAGPLQLHGGASYSLWAVDTRTHDLVLEYNSGLLIRRHDRIGSLYAHALFHPDSGMSALGFTMDGFGARNQLWWTVQTGLSQNLISTGLSGMRYGKNGSRLYRGLDLWIGYWTRHPQLAAVDAWKKLNISLEWTWNIQILDLTEL